MKVGEWLWTFFILEGVDLLDHTSIFLLRTINHRVIPIIRIRIIGITR